MCTYNYKEYEGKFESTSFPITPPHDYCAPISHHVPCTPTPSPQHPMLKPSPRPRPNKLYLESLGIPATKQEADIKYLVHKCQISKSILKQNWCILLPKCSNFLTIVDKDKVAYEVSSKDLNNILSSGFFSENEQKTIKKMRYQGRNNMAAKLMREKYKARDRRVESELTKLKQKKLELQHEKEKLKEEISQYKQYFSRFEINDES